MKEKPLKRQLIHVLSRYSNWRTEGIRQSLRSEKIYAGRGEWISFLNFFLLGLGAAFLICGIVFFFAFNWNNLHKFVKLGLIQTLILACGGWVVWGKSSDLLRRVLLTVMSCLTGVLFAVFGQIYQTGANAADFFLGWTLFVVIWALISDFPPLWLIFLVLLQTTFVLHSNEMLERLASLMPFSIAVGLNKAIAAGYDLTYALLAGLNIAVVVFTEWLNHKKGLKGRASWFTYIVALTAVVLLTFVVSTGIYRKYTPVFLFSMVLGAASYAAGVYYGFLTRNIFYLSSVGFSVIIILTALLIKPFDNPIGIFFVAGLFLVLTTTLLIRGIIRLNKKWHAG